MDYSTFDSFLPKTNSVYDQFLMAAEKITAPKTIAEKLRAQAVKAKASAEVPQQNFTATRLPEGLRLGFL